MKLKPSICISAVLVSLALYALLCYNGKNKVPAKSFFDFIRIAPQQLYKLDADWPRNPESIRGVPFDVAVDHLNSLVYVAQRGDNVSKVLVFTEEGYFKTAWKTNTLEMPHGIFAVIDDENLKSIWITDVGQGPYGHTVKQYSPSGALLKILGTPGIAGSRLSPLQFDQPADIFIKGEDEIYIVDGDGGLNNRLLKLTDDFSLQWTLGGNGTKPGQFYIPHSVAVDDVGRVSALNKPFSANIHCLCFMFHI
ncbi:NHL repeat-containing protein 3 [Rhinoderma darwinii]|uniref:NHL repeat-containing protein 3 n=1 Tax=Rhinoderma darwinii TaxID=43563 RepID=UPI003F68178B